MATPVTFRFPLSKIEGRLDPRFYAELPDLNGFVRLSTLASVSGGKRLPEGATYETEESDYFYLRVADINDHGDIDFQNIRYLNKETFDFLNRYEIKNDELAISIAGTVGRICLVEGIAEGKRAILTENCAKISIKNKYVTPQFLSTLLNSAVVQKQIELGYIQTTIPKLGLERIKGLYLPPIPSPYIQQKIVGLMQAAYAKKKHKEAEAARLLGSMDEMLYRHLGIALPKPSSNTLPERMFRVQKNKLVGMRLDAPANLNRFTLMSKTFANIALLKVAKLNPPTNHPHIPPETPLTFLPMECVDDVYGRIQSPQVRCYGESKGYTEFQESDLLWAKITPCMQNGKSAVATSLLNGYGFGSTEFHVFRVNPEILNVYYLHALLRLKNLRISAMSFFGGSAGHQRVDEVFFKNLTIPVPPLPIQNSIVDEIHALEHKATSLREQARQAVEAAKADVEHLILGKATT